MKKKVIFDCDPGHDDAIAIMLAAHHLDILGITAIGGNTSLENVVKNALKILEVIGREDIPVYPGHCVPMVFPLVTAPQFHGETGLEGPNLPEPKIKAQDKHGVDFIIDTVREVDDVTIIATGPLTNIASAIHKAPDIVNRIKEISIMGGSVTFGNWTPTAEFNIFVDPEAAYKVFNSGVHVKMSGINLTRQCTIGKKELEIIQEINTKTGQLAYGLIKFFLRAAEKAANLATADLHDVCAVLWVIDEDIFVKGAPMHITVELKGEYTRGMTVCDYRHLRTIDPKIDLSRTPVIDYRGEKPNAEGGLELNVEKFREILYSTLKELP